MFKYFKGFRLVWTVLKEALAGDTGKLLFLGFPTEIDAATARREFYLANLRNELALADAKMELELEVESE